MKKLKTPSRLLWKINVVLLRSKLDPRYFRCSGTLTSPNNLLYDFRISDKLEKNPKPQLACPAVEL